MVKESTGDQDTGREATTTAKRSRAEGVRSDTPRRSRGSREAREGNGRSARRTIKHPHRSKAMTQDSNGKFIKNITECAAGADTFYIVYYKDGSCRTYTRATGVITKWLQNNC